MFSFKIKLKIDPQTMAKLQPESLEHEVTSAAVEACETLVKDNFRKLERERNVHGSHFYEKLGFNATRAVVRRNRGVIIVDSYEMAHKYFGGEVRPKRSKFLAIPNEDEYFRRPPRSIGHGKLGYRKTRNGGLLYELKNPNRIAYWLVKKVVHRARKETLPSRAELMKTAKQAAADYLKTI